MQRGYIEATAVIAAPPDDIYAILADYRHGHPRILPKPYFSEIEVEQGGMGAGTVIRLHMRVFGRERVFLQSISEPDIGRVLVETDIDTGTATTFTVTPVDSGRQSHVQIRTEWAVRPGVMGWLERGLTRRVLRSIYTKELQQLAAYVAGSRSSESTVERERSLV